MWLAFKNVLFWLLQWFYAFVNDWGLAIILLTVLIRLALLPLTMKQTKSMYELQRIQPKLKALQEKYKDDKEKQQEELLKFYQENKVNPFGGCLPMLIQMPFFFALYQVIGGTAKKPGLLLQYLDKLAGAEQTQQVKSLWGLIVDITSTPSAMFSVYQKSHAATDLLAFAPYIILVILFGLSIWLPQYLMPGEKQQKMIGAYMGIMFLYFGWVSPAGVLLYWVTSSAWGLAQQQLTIKWMGSHAADDDAAPTAKDSKAKAEDPALAEKTPTSTGSKSKKRKKK